MYSIHDWCKQQCGYIRWLVYTILHAWSAMHSRNITWDCQQVVTYAYIQSMGVTLVSFPDPALKKGKGLVYIERFLGCTGCSISCDWHDNASFWHGNASTALTRMGGITL